MNDSSSSGEGDPRESTDAQPVDDKVVRVDFQQRARAKAASRAAAPEKLQAFEERIARGMVMLTLDVRVAGVVVPPRFAGDMQLNLNFSHRFGVADFRYDSVGVRCTLTFGGVPTFVDIAWAAVWAMRSHADEPERVVVWQDSIPAELLAMLPPAAREQLKIAQVRSDREAEVTTTTRVAPPAPASAHHTDAQHTDPQHTDPHHTVDAPPDPPAPPSPAGPRPALRLIK